MYIYIALQLYFALFIAKSKSDYTIGQQIRANKRLLNEHYNSTHGLFHGQWATVIIMAIIPDICVLCQQFSIVGPLQMRRLIKRQKGSEG